MAELQTLFDRPFTKSGIRTLRRSIRTANGRIQILERNGVRSDHVARVRNNNGGSSKIYLSKNPTIEEFERVSVLVDQIIGTNETTLKRAQTIEKYREENFLKTLSRALGREVTPELAAAVRAYIPEDDLQRYIEDFSYEHISAVAEQMMSSGITYAQDLMEMALKTSVENVIREIFKESGEFEERDIDDYTIENYVDMAIQTDISQALKAYRDFKERRIHEEYEDDFLE